MGRHIADRGFLTFAFNTDAADYIKMAVCLANSVHETQNIKRISLVTDQESRDTMTEDHVSLFDTIAIVSKPVTKGKSFWHEPLAWKLTPYRSTFKVEADILLTSSLDHYWQIFQDRSVTLPIGAMTYWNQPIIDRSQRKLFDDNGFPDVYTAIYHFNYTDEASKFFALVRNIYDNWAWFRDEWLVNCRHQNPQTDEVFAIAALKMGVAKFIAPDSHFSFVHMKNKLQGIPTDDNWWNYIYFEKDNSYVNVGHFRQKYPLHYVDKGFVDVLGKYYDRHA